jgi:hypothetical protein
MHITEKKKEFWFNSEFRSKFAESLCSIFFRCEVMSIVPRTVEEIEDWMSGSGEETINPIPK